MTETVSKRRSDRTISHIQSLPVISMISTLIFAIIFATGKGYEYGGTYAPQETGYSANSYSHNTYSAPSPPPQYEQYTAVTYQELNVSYHCGVIPDTNYELYRSTSDPYEVAEVAPFGKFPWIVLILLYNKVICQGTLVHHNLILTSAKCIPEYTSLEDYEIRIGDWDLLTDYNEYEAYTDREIRVCSKHALTQYIYGGGKYKNYQQIRSYSGDDSSDLILIKSDFEPSYKFPHVKPICLPKMYSSPSYYNGGQDQYASYSVCWVAGWYGSEITPLQNHPQPEKVMGYGGYSSSYGNSRSYSQKYYKGYDSSMIQKRAKVKQVACSYSSSSNEVCFIGVDGYDACVADQGAAVFCVIQEDQSYGEYDSGYNNQNSYSSPSSGYAYESVDASYEIPVMSSLHPDYDAQKVNSYSYSKPQIKAAPAPSKPQRFRAVLYAVVQKAAKCRVGYDSYGNLYSRKSMPLVATRVDYEAVSGIMDQFWTHGYDQSCPVTSAKYKAPRRSYAKSYKSSYYFSSYYNAPKGNYGYNRQAMNNKNYY